MRTIVFAFCGLEKSKLSLCSNNFLCAGPGRFVLLLAKPFSLILAFPGDQLILFT